jgi:hypothetical protein
MVGRLVHPSGEDKRSGGSTDEDRGSKSLAVASDLYSSIAVF